MRLVVKNLPKFCTKSDIEKEFKKHGSLTDIFMLENYKKEFRRVCFIGYLSEEESLAALNYRNNSMFLNHKIKVEVLKERENVKSESVQRKVFYSKKIYMRGLSSDIGKDLIKEKINKIGKTKEIVFKKVKNTRKSENSNFLTKNDLNIIISFENSKDAVKALSIKSFLGKKVKVGSYIETIEKKDHFNTLFFNFETVIKRTCELEKIDKENILDLKDKELGSKIALLESNLVKQTKEFLKENDFDIENITEEKDYKKLIFRCSDLLLALELIKGNFKSKIAPSKCLAILIFENEEEAIETQRKMNLKRFRNEVIYCEFFNKTKKTEKKENKEEIKKTKGTNKILIKNVPFQANKQDIYNIFVNLSKVKEVRLPKKNKTSHRGFCFVLFYSEEDAKKAIENFGSSTHLYGRKLILEIAKT